MSTLLIIKMTQRFKIKSLLIFTFFAIGCENSSSIQNEYIDPQIIFSSRRWWNYDIFIHDIYASQSTQLTKNKWIDFNPSISPNSKNYYLFQIEMETERFIVWN